jgi:hypothetical protein
MYYYFICFSYHSDPMMVPIYLVVGKSFCHPSTVDLHINLNFLSFLGNSSFSDELFISSMLPHFVGDLHLSFKWSWWFFSSHSSSIVFPQMLFTYFTLISCHFRPRVWSYQMNFHWGCSNSHGCRVRFRGWISF